MIWCYDQRKESDHFAYADDFCLITTDMRAHAQEAYS